MVAKNVITNMSLLHVFEDKASKSRFLAWQSFYSTTCICHEMGEQNQFL